MARISGVDLPREKRIEIGLTYVYGIGRVRATKILAEAGVNPDTRVKDLTDEEVANVLTFVYSTWGNNKKEITPDMVAKMRKSTK